MGELGLRLGTRVLGVWGYEEFMVESVGSSSSWI